MTNQPFNFEIHKSAIIDLIGEDVFNEIILDNNHPYDIEDRYIQEGMLFLNGRRDLWDTLLYSDKNFQEKIFESDFFLWNDTLNDKGDELLSHLDRAMIDSSFMINRPALDLYKVKDIYNLSEALINEKGGYIKNIFPFHDYDKTNEIYKEIIHSFDITPMGIDAGKISELAHLRLFLFEQLKVQAEKINWNHKKIENIIKVYAYQTLNTAYIMDNYHRKRGYSFLGMIDGEFVERPYYEDKIFDSEEKRESSEKVIPTNGIEQEVTIFVNYLLNKIYKHIPRDEKEWLDIKKIMLSNPFLPHYFKWSQFLGVLEYSVVKEPIQYATKRMIAQLSAIESILEDYYLDIDLKSLSQYSKFDKEQNYRRTIGDTRLTFEQLSNYMPDIKEVAKEIDVHNSDPKGSDRSLIIKSLKAGEIYILKKNIFEPNRNVSAIIREILDQVPELNKSQNTSIRAWVNKYFTIWHANVLNRE